jgi:hypothetical protein
MELPGKQQELINRVASVAKKPVVLVLLSGGLVIPAKLEEVRWRVSIRYCCLGSPASTYPAISEDSDTTLGSGISSNNWCASLISWSRLGWSEFPTPSPRGWPASHPRGGRRDLGVACSHPLPRGVVVPQTPIFFIFYFFKKIKKYEK